MTATPNDFFVGEDVVWMYTPKGGYGYVFKIPAVVKG